MIQILKASAGSGKTFNLAKTYIRMVLTSEDRFAYRSVLAVTFTNKATAEMKNRILKELGILASDPTKSDYYRDFVPKHFPDGQSLKEKAKSVLVDLLHDYGAFSVSTIDKFFQQTLKAFAREIGQFSTYQIELDRNSLIDEAVDRILDNLTEEDTQLLSWLDESVSEQLGKGERVSLEKGLYEMARKFSSEDYDRAVERYGIDEGQAFSKERLSEIQKTCRKIVSSYVKDVRDTARLILDSVRDAGLGIEDFPKGFLTPVVANANLKPFGAVTKLNATFVKRAPDPASWFTKDKAFLRDRVEASLSGPFDRFLSLFGDTYVRYNTARKLLDQLYALGLAGEFRKEFHNLLREKNVLGIDDSNTLLRRIIG